MDSYYVPRTQKAVFGNLALWVIGLVVLSSVITASLWGAGVIFAPAKGKAGAFKQKESANNRLFAQANFEQLNADIDGYIGKIAAAKLAVSAAAATADTTDDGLRATELIGVRQLCIDAIQQYDADSRKYLLRDFKSAGLSPRRYIEECK